MPNFSLNDVITDIPMVTIIDIGAMVVGQEQVFCKPLIAKGKARTIAFEPDERECAKVNVKLGKPHKCLPYFVGDGTERTFFQTNMTMTGSLYPPNRKVVDKYAHLGEAMQLVATHPVKTVRLDEVIEVGDADLLKMDVQGAEVDVLRGATRSLKAVTIVQSEVCFVDLYEGQCLFADIDRHLREQGFAFHTFLPISGRPLKPLVTGNDPNRPFKQLLWTDAVYVRDITSPPIVWSRLSYSAWRCCCTTSTARSISAPLFWAKWTGAKGRGIRPPTWLPSCAINRRLDQGEPSSSDDSKSMDGKHRQFA